MASETGPEVTKPGAVFDCMVFLQGAGRPASPARACLDLVDEGRVTLFLSADILAELRDVLTRPKTLRRFPRLTSEYVSTFLQNAESKSIALASVPRGYAFDRDPKDEPYLNLAIAAKAKYLVSRDADLPDLMKDAGFRRQYPDLEILDPVVFLRTMRAETPES
jgi:putative PIN family toxin of toxin-antitoxin system